MQIDSLLEPLSIASPCGENLEYDAEFLALQQGIVGKGEQQFGTTIIPAEEPAWNQVEKQALALLARTRDVRIAVWLTQAWTEMSGVAGYAQGTSAVRGLLESFWDTVHPVLAAHGETDPLPRMNAIEALGDAQGVGRALRASVLLRSAFGSLTLREAEAMLDGTRDNQAYPGGRGRVVDDLRRASADQAPELLATGVALDNLLQIRDLCARHLGDEWGPQFAGIAKTLSTLCNAAGHLPETRSEDEISAAPADMSHALVDALPGVPAIAAPAIDVPDSHTWRGAVIRDRADAVAMLEKVCSYFETKEPSHPAPFLIRRVQRLATANFHELVRDLAPAGMAQFETLLGPGAGESH